MERAAHPGDAGLDERHVGEHHAAPATLLVFRLPDPSLIPRIKTVGNQEVPKGCEILVNLRVILTVKNIRMNQSSEVLLVFNIL